jgi:hypothetical protein
MVVVKNKRNIQHTHILGFKDRNARSVKLLYGEKRNAHRGSSGARYLP